LKIESYLYAGISNSMPRARADNRSTVVADAFGASGFASAALGSAGFGSVGFGSADFSGGNCAASAGSRRTFTVTKALSAARRPLSSITCPSNVR
jgi:hypothetical protein